MSWIQNAFTQKGYLVLFVDETATQLSNGGAPWRLTRNNREYQYRVTQLMLAKEEVFTGIARTFDAEKILIVCDRGALDNRAYMTAEEFRYVLDKLNTSEVELRDHYDAVFHLVTAAKGAEEFYTHANNAARYETPEEAVKSDDALIAAWTGHPHLRVIDNLSAAGYMCHSDSVAAIEIDDACGSLNRLLSVISAGNINLDYLYVTYSSLSRNPVAILRCSDLSEVVEFLSSRGYHSLSRLD